LPSLFETRRRLPTSATTLSTCGQPNPGSFVSHRDEGLDLLPFLSPHALSLAEAVKSGELRFFVRSNRPQCWFFRVAPVCPTVMPIRSPHQPTLACWLHSEDLRAQVEGLSEGRVLCRAGNGFLVLAPSAYALWRMRDGVPLLSCLRTSAVIGAFARLGGTHSSRRTDLGPRSDNAPRSALPSRRPGCLSPLRHAKDLFGTRRDCSLRPSRRLSRSRRPHFLPKLGSVFLIGHCKFTVQSPARP
jgi:hypothetical protein